MRIITEDDALSIKGNVEVIGNGKKLHNRSRAEAIANYSSDLGEPMLCEYVVRSSSGRKVKRYLPLVRKEI